ncbi:MAG: U32 family peptidase [Tissierellia bacterium]|nr:U32 family peptidase [Tissierellia bacterium]
MGQIKELLAPAGSLEAFYAGVASGADAIYLGGKAFSARASASNFSLEEIEEAVTYAHIHQVGVHVATNILIGEEEMEEALAYVHDLYRVGVDAVIVQDLGLAQLIRQNFPDLDLHGSTQMTVMDLEGAKFLEDLGFSRVVVARETPLDQIEKIARKTSLEVEVFAHGALCVAISGQCLMSSFIGGRSGNRGACAQPCRKPYDILKRGEEKVLGQGYMLSPKDLNTIDRLSDWAQAGVYSLKLEGRMKSPAYVAAITRNYRRALDGKTYSSQDMAQAFNRGFTQGLSFGDFGESYASVHRPDNRGLRVGKVRDIRGKRIQLLLEEDLRKGDLLEFSLPRERKKTHKLEGDLREGLHNLNLPFRPLNRSEIRRIISQDQLDQVAKDLKKQEGTLPLKGHLTLEVGQVPRLLLKGKRQVEVEGSLPVQKAQKAPLSQERIRESLEKFGSSVFYLEDLTLDFRGQADIFLPIKELNYLRREALKAYEDLYQGKRPGKASLNFYRETPTRENRETVLAARVDSLALLKRLDLGRLGRVYYSQLEDLEAAADFLKDYPGDFYLSLDLGVPHQRVEAALRKLARRPDGLLVANYGQMVHFKGAYPLHLGSGFNIFNGWSLSRLLEEAGEFTLSLENHHQQLAAFYRDFGQLGHIPVYGYQKLMTLKHCPMALIKKCQAPRPCKTCNFREGYGLRDGRGAYFPIVRREDISSLYNSLPTYLGGELEDLLRMGPQSLLLDFHFQEEDVEGIIEAFAQALSGQTASLKDLNDHFQKEGHTKGHWNRGIF